jgi:hypothetical protein
LEKILLYSPFEGTEKGILKYKAALHGVFETNPRTSFSSRWLRIV